MDVYTTASVWNPVTRAWELGEETGPVRADEAFVPYTDAEFEEECVDEPDVKGEQGNNNPPPMVEVKGVQGVPTAVDAGLGGDNSPIPAGRNPLWLMVIGGGLGLMGSAGLRRRTAAHR